MIQVTIPAGVQEGAQFQVNTPSGPTIVNCPPGCKPGDTIAVEMPTVAVAGAPMVSLVMAREPPDFDMAALVAFTKKLPGEFVGAPVTIKGCIKLNPSYSVRNMGASCCGCCPFPGGRVSWQGEWEATDLTRRWAISNGGHQTITITKCDGTFLAGDVTGNDPQQGPIKGTQVMTVNTSTMKMVIGKMGELTFDFKRVATAG